MIKQGVFKPLMGTSGFLSCSQEPFSWRNEECTIGLSSSTLLTRAVKLDSYPGLIDQISSYSFFDFFPQVPECCLCQFTPHSRCCFRIISPTFPSFLASRDGNRSGAFTELLSFHTLFPSAQFVFPLYTKELQGGKLINPIKAKVE